MNKAARVLLIVAASVVGLFIVCGILFVLWCNGTFDFLNVKDVASYQSPNGEYQLYFKSVGDPQWPFGPAKVRLVLKNADGRTLQSYDTAVSDDGAAASEWNVKEVAWGNDSVQIVLRGSEQSDETVLLHASD